MKKLHFFVLCLAITSLTGCGNVLIPYALTAGQMVANASLKSSQEEERKKEEENLKRLKAEQEAMEAERHQQEIARRQQQDAAREKQALHAKAEGERLYREAMKYRGTEKSFYILQDAARYGNLDAHFQLGSAYLNGKVIGFNPAVAIDHFQYAAAHKHAPSQFALGVYYFEKFEISRDDSDLYRAYIMLEASSRNGIKDASLKAEKARALLKRDTGNEGRNRTLRYFLRKSEQDIQRLTNQK